MEEINPKGEGNIKRLKKNKRIRKEKKRKKNPKIIKE